MTSKSVSVLLFPVKHCEERGVKPKLGLWRLNLDADRAVQDCCHAGQRGLNVKFRAFTFDFPYLTHKRFSRLPGGI